MYKVNHRTLPYTQYFLTIAEAKKFCKYVGVSTRNIKPVH